MHCFTIASYTKYCNKKKKKKVKGRKPKRLKDAKTRGLCSSTKMHFENSFLIRQDLWLRCSWRNLTRHFLAGFYRWMWPHIAWTRGYPFRLKQQPFMGFVTFSAVLRNFLMMGHSRLTLF